jgi:hypothetical protein
MTMTQADRDAAILWWKSKTGFGGDHLEQLAQAFAAHAAAERAGMIAWLRAGGKYGQDHIGPPTKALFDSLADAFERGEDKQADTCPHGSTGPCSICGDMG